MSLERVPAGEFMMGSSDTYKDAASDEKPQHKVRLDEYLIGKYPVTVAQFRAFVQASGCKAESGALCTRKDNHPVNYVSWNDAIAFCQWASQVTGRTVRLPTEAEWEKAARGTDGRIYPWGNQTPDSSLCNFNYDVGDTTTVGKYSPSGDSPCGCADMAGNVWEWVNDWYAADYYASWPGSNPSGPATGTSRVLRGGGWSNTANYVRSVYLPYSDPGDRNGPLDFRCAVSPGI